MHEAMDRLGFKRPDSVGASEYRSIYETIEDALEDVEEGTEHEFTLAMLAEFAEWAEGMQRLLAPANA